MSEYHKILGVAPDAPPEVIKAAFRALMKIHHPDVGGKPERARMIEEAYRKLLLAKPQPRTNPIKPPKPSGSENGLSNLGYRGKFLQLSLEGFKFNKIFPCPPECVFFKRLCRHRQLLPGIDTGNSPAVFATTLEIRVRNLQDFSQTIDCRAGRAVLIDQTGEFYESKPMCGTLHPLRYKEASFEMFSATQAVFCLWFQTLPPGRHISRFVYKHRVLVPKPQGEFWDEELIDISISPTQIRFLNAKK
ncbi:MAG: J domain-containing protein [Firmicutes bacterium]|nr:J domain-containing protein [Bacillota bacterium]